MRYDNYRENAAATLTKKSWKPATRGLRRRLMITKEWRNHADERIAALFTAQEESNRQIQQSNKQIQESNRQIQEINKQMQEINRGLSDNILETNRLLKENSAETEAQIKLLLEAQINANQRMDRADHRMDRLEENLDRVIRKVDTWLDNLHGRNGA
jgi:DNA repair exonuclease SbcCD ATPase subunit